MTPARESKLNWKEDENLVDDECHTKHRTSFNSNWQEKRCLTVKALKNTSK